jgi:major vault protein
MSDATVVRIKPFFYIHVLDNNLNVTRVEVGPQTFTRQDHEKVVFGPESMVMIPPRHYVVISNPIVRSAENNPVLDEFKNVRLRHGDEEIRFEQEPFPLYPGEKLVGKINPLQVVAPNSALRLRATRDFLDGKVKRAAGEEWLHPGPGTYVPRVEVQVVEVIKAIILKPHTALKLRARKACVDAYNNARKAGEEWLVRETGAYLPRVDEEVIEQVNAHVLTDKIALHLRASRTFTYANGRQRKAGEEWLVTVQDAEVYISDVYEELVGTVKLTTLTNRQYCVVLDPYDAKGKQQFGQKEVRKGEASFFLRPGERLEAGIQSVYVLTDEEALLLRAKEEFAEADKKHLPGDRWMIYGPTDYVPPVQVEIIEKRKSIPLDTNEGIYVRDIQTGKVRSVIGQSYKLSPYEELWAKELPKTVEDLLIALNPTNAARDKTRVVTVRAPHNTAMQIYDYKEKKSRVVWGPDLVMLGPDEQFTVLSLSGDKPKRPHAIKALALQLGPEFMTDIITVETSDHARLALKLSYNWIFEVITRKEADGNKIFQVPDFVGDACKAVAARVRGAVAAITFDNFHKNSAKIIRTAVFGADETGKVRSKFLFEANLLALTNIDIQSVEPVDQRTRDSLQKSVQLAIEITTKSQEAAARHEAERLEQEAKGRLERQKINDESEAEKARKTLIQLQAESASVESAGQATAEARARATAAEIEGQSQVKQATLRAQASTTASQAGLAQTEARQKAEVEHQAQLNKLEIEKSQSLSDIEAVKFKEIVDAIGAKTIAAIARSGPEMQAKLLKGLGLKSLMITDGHSPINLFNTAQGLVAPGFGGAAPARLDIKRDDSGSFDG